MDKKRFGYSLLLPVLAGFFIMAFSDMAAPVSSRVAAQFGEEYHAWIGFLPSMVFLWFLFLALPTASLMSRWGRKRMVLMGYLLTIFGLVIPYLAAEWHLFGLFFLGFALLGLGNMILQVAVNPMLAAVAPEGEMARYLTVGQIFRNLALMLFAPLLLLMEYLGSWEEIFLLYGVLTTIACVWLYLIAVPETRRCVHRSSMKDCLRLLQHPRIRYGVVGVGLFLMTDVACGFLAAHLVDDPSSLLTTTGYYAFRIVGTLLAVVLLRRIAELNYLLATLVLALLAALLIPFVEADVWVYLLFGLIGFVCAIPFATFYAEAMRAAGDREDEAAGLLVMAIAAGALSSPICNAIIGWTDEARWGMCFVALCILLMMGVAWRLKKMEAVIVTEK